MTQRNTALFHIRVRIKRGVFKALTTTRQFTSRGMIDGISRTRLARVCETWLENGGLRWLFFPTRLVR